MQAKTAQNETSSKAGQNATIKAMQAKTAQNETQHAKHYRGCEAYKLGLKRIKHQSKKEKGCPVSPDF
jgi:hypothetical protein